jgi:hypothetical protein
MTLAPIGTLFEVKSRPETVLEVSHALRDPLRTVADYYFTDTIRGYFRTVFDKVEVGRGQGFWVRAQYGGGKTHLLATLTALLSGPPEVWDQVADEEISHWRRPLSKVRLFPVVFSLRGRGAATSDVELTLYDVFEEEIKREAQHRLGLPLRLSTADEVLGWWERLADGLRNDLNGWVSRQYGRTADDLRGSPDEFKDAVLAAAEANHVRVPLQGQTGQRLRTAYDQLVNRQTDYTGLLVVIDEFAFWQGLHPEGSTEAARDEEFLETLGWSLPKTGDLAIYTIVASQRPQPAKLLAGSTEGRFITLEVSSAKDAQTELWEYQQIVSHRVRALRPERAPEIEEHYHDADYRYGLGRRLPLDRFRVVFPVEPTCYEILQRITDELASERVGINVLWEVLAEELEGGGARVRPQLQDRRRLVFAPDLLGSPNLRAALTDSAYQEHFRLLEVARDGLEHFAAELDAEERELAGHLLDTLFLWHLAHLRSPRPMDVTVLTGAVLAEVGQYNNAQEAVESVLSVIASLEQLDYDAKQGTARFVARAVTGRTAQSVFTDARRRPISQAEFERKWSERLRDQALAHNGLTALFAGLVPAQADKLPLAWKQIEYDGRQMLVDTWRGELGAELRPDEGFFRVVYLVQPDEVAPDALQGDRIAVCVPRPFTEGERDALKAVIALDDMDKAYSDRNDDEALRVQEFVRSKRPDFTVELLRQQQQHYRNGRIVTRAALSVDPKQVFQQPHPRDRATAIVDAMFAYAFAQRPLGEFRGSAPFAASTPGLIFEGLFKPGAKRLAIEAVTTFGPGLGLTTAEKPQEFNADAAPALAHLRRWFGEACAGNQVLPTWQVYERFAALGIPRRLATLFLLAFVRRPAEGAELLLKPDARVAIGGAIGGHRNIGYTAVPQVEWSPAVAEGQAFEALTARTSVDWGTAVEWLRALQPDLRATHAPEEIESEAERALARGHELAAAIPSAREALGRLAYMLEEPPPTEATEALTTVAALADAGTYTDLYDRARAAVDGDRERFLRTVATAQRVRELAPQAVSVQATVQYLRALDGRFGTDDVQLEAERQNVLRQLTVPALLAGRWGDLAEQFAQFRNRYRPRYQKFHRDYREALVQLGQYHRALERDLQVLERLDRLTQLGAPAAATHRARWQTLGMGLQPCAVADVSAVSVEQASACERCQVPYGAESPGAGVQALAAAIRGAGAEKLHLLRSLLLTRLDREATGAVRDLADAVAIGGSELSELFANSDEAVTIATRLLADAAVVCSDALRRLRDEFPTYSATTLDQVAARFRQLLDEDLAKAGPNAELRLD